MSARSSFSIQNLGKRTLPDGQAIESALAQVPQATLIISRLSWNIVYNNLAACELFGLAAKELTDTDLRSLFTDWTDRQIGTSSENKYNLLHISNTQLNARSVSLFLQPLAGKKDLTLVSIQFVDAGGSPAPDSRSNNEKVLNSLGRLFDALEIEDMAEALQEASQAGMDFLECSTLAVYLTGETSPELHQAVYAGGASVLPLSLPLQDLAYLKSPQLWVPEKRAQTNLHRTAQKNGLTWVATAPLGKPTAAIGLIAAAANRPIAPAQAESSLGIVANILNTLIERQSLHIQIDRARLERTRGQSEIEALSHSVVEGILILTPAMKVMRANPTVEVIFGYPADEIVGVDASSILIGNEQIEKTLDQAQTISEIIRLENVRLYRRYGEVFLANLMLVPLFINQDLDRILICIQDLSETERVRERAQQLEQRALLGEFTAIFAHEVRNPINNISTGLELMALNLPPEDTHQDLIHRLQQDCDRLAELMKSVLAFSKPAEYSMEPLELRPFMQRLLDRLSLRMSKSNVRCTLQADDPIPQVLADYRALEQAIINLITNAINAMGEQGGQLTVKIIAPKALRQKLGLGKMTHVELSIVDTGPGIPKELQDRIFQPFFTTNRTGTGLGLAISKRIVTDHRGTISLTSFPGGTVFTIRLPVIGEILEDNQ